MTSPQRQLAAHLVFLLVSCGHPQPLPKPHLIGGTVTSPDRFPYLSSIITREQEKMNHHTCAAMLIAPDLILTASHCPPPLEGIEIGRYNIDSENDRSEVPGQTFERFVFEDEVRHPDYCPSDEARENGCVKRENDFMIMKLYGKSEVPFVRINTDANLPSTDGEEMTVIGWGMTDAEVWELSPRMREIEVNYIPNSVCSTIEVEYEGDEIRYAKRLTPRMMCAADVHGTDDSCYGDSGGPLIHKGNSIDQDVLLGIVSYGFGCAEPGLPGIYSRVSALAEDWLIPQICEMSAYAPSLYNCPELTELPGDYGPEVRLRIRFDDDPEDVGWVLKEVNSGKIYSYAPIGTYGEEYEGEEVDIVVEVDAGKFGKTYKFALLDWNFNGMKDGDDGSYEIYLDGDLIIEGSGRFEGHAAEHEFFVAAPPTPEPTYEPTPLTKAPTPSPTLEPSTSSPTLNPASAPVVPPTTWQDPMAHQSQTAQQKSDSSGSVVVYNTYTSLFLLGLVVVALLDR